MLQERRVPGAVQLVGILAQIEDLVGTEEVIDEEYDGFLEWILYSVDCHEEVCGEDGGSCGGGPTESANAPDGVLSPLGSCEEEALLQSFQSKVYKWRGRGHGCHSNCKPDYAAPCWLIYPEDKENEAQVAEGSMLSMYNVLGLDFVDFDEPFQSPFLLKPADENKLGGVEHGGGAKFYDQADDAYQDYKIWLEQYAACYQGLEPQLPVVNIHVPKNKKKYTLGAGMILVGSALDPQDGEVVPESLVWRSNLVDEPVAIGEGPTNVDLPEGKHLLTLEATDADGNVGTRTVKVWVQAPDTD